MKHRGDPKVFRDFRDFGFKAIYEGLKDTSCVSTKLEAAYQKAASRFRKKKTWHGSKIVDIATEVGLGAIHRTFYVLMSSATHADPLPSMMEAGVAWKNTGVSMDDHFAELSFEGSYMLMASLYENTVKCLRLSRFKLEESPLRNEDLRISIALCLTRNREASRPMKHTQSHRLHQFLEWNR